VIVGQIVFSPRERVLEKKFFFMNLYNKTGMEFNNSL